MESLVKIIKSLCWGSWGSDGVQRIAEDIRVQAFDLARKMAIEGIQDEEESKSKQK